MAVYFVTGKLGSGKTLAAVGRIRDYLQQGRRVATNLTLNLEKLIPANSRQTVTRVPDKPRLEDLEGLGTGDGAPVEQYDESRFGLLVLDELSSWLNARSWNDKERGPVLEWFVHARKFHWDVILIVQDISVVDKQLRETLCEHLVICRRLDRIGLPLIGGLLKLLTGKRFTLPKAHVGTVYFGDNEQALRVDRWWYRGRDLYAGYFTGQVFTLDHLRLDGEPVDMRASYTMLSPWHLVGRYGSKRTLWDRLRFVLAIAVKLPLWGLCWMRGWTAGRSPAAQARRWGML